MDKFTIKVVNNISTKKRELAANLLISDDEYILAKVGADAEATPAKLSTITSVENYIPLTDIGMSLVLIIAAIFIYLFLLKNAEAFYFYIFIAIVCFTLIDLAWTIFKILTSFRFRDTIGNDYTLYFYSLTKYKLVKKVFASAITNAGLKEGSLPPTEDVNKQD